MQQDPLTALRAELRLAPHRSIWPRLLVLLFIKRGNWGAIALIRLAQLFRVRGSRLLAQLATNRLRRDFGCFVHPGAQIGAGLRLPHPNGVVIGSGVMIGANCTLYQQVTLGARRSGEVSSAAYPHLGDGVTVFAGAKLIGPIRIGDGAIIGANAVVLTNVPSGHRALGVPAIVSPLVEHRGDAAETMPEHR